VPLVDRDRGERAGRGTLDVEVAPAVRESVRPRGADVVPVAADLDAEGESGAERPERRDAEREGRVAESVRVEARGDAAGQGERPAVLRGERRAEREEGQEGDCERAGGRHVDLLRRVTDPRSHPAVPAP
jgi:hypothetical protein